ncbi:MAG: helix-turn-helix transcriptional regulator [Clostridia bacterium]|nr:helix-turn-helix transcriptional regulator [Clostridia bacterium]
MEEIVYSRFEDKDGFSFNNSIDYADSKSRKLQKADSHNLIEILYLKAGEVTYSIDGKIFKARKGDLIVINQQEFHSLNISTDQPFHRLNIHFSPDFIPRLSSVDLLRPFSLTKRYQHLIPKQLVEKSKIPAIFTKISKTASVKSPYRMPNLIILLQQLIIEINQVVDLLLNDNLHLISSPTHINPYIVKTIEYINLHLENPISVDDIANEIGLAKDYLRHLFKDSIGVTLSDYIEIQKMQTALILLRQGNSPKNVSLMLGYDNYTTFFLQFKKVFNILPSQA